MFTSFFGYSQSKFFFGVNAGKSFINNNVLSSSVAGAEFSNRPSIVFPALAGVFISEKSRVRFDLDSFKMKLKLNNNLLQNGGPSVPNQSEVSISAEALNLNYDYRLFGRGKLHIYASAGSRLLFSTKKKEVTTYGDGQVKESDILIYDYCRNIFGLGTGVLAKYNHTDKIGFTFTPD